MPYTRPYTGGFKDYPDTTTPINATALNTMDVGIKTANDQFQTVTTAQRTALSPTVGQAVWDSDLKQLMVYMNASGGNAWQPVGNRIVCASTTRPSTPFHGQMIYETDTKKEFVYNGTAWVQTNSTSTTSGVTGVSNLIVPPSVEVYRSTDLTSYTTASKITWDSKNWDTDGTFTAPSTDITIQTTGLYFLSGYLYWNATATVTSVAVEILKGATTILGGSQPVSSSTGTIVQRTGVVSLTAGDVLSVDAAFVGGSAYIIKGGTAASYTTSKFTAVWIGRTS